MAQQRIVGAWLASLLAVCALAACGDDSDAADTVVVDTIGAMEVSTVAEDVAAYRASLAKQYHQSSRQPAGNRGR